MSTVIDERQIDFIFNNKDAIKNIEASLDAIERFKKILNFKDSKKSLEGLSKSINNLNFNNVSDSVNKLDHSFSSLIQNISKIYTIKEGIRAFDILKDTIVSVTKSVTGLEMAQKGLDKYWQKTQAVQTIMSATGKSIDYVSDALEKLNWFTDETSYNFVDMVENIGKFTSAGIDLDDAVKAMEGISNWASTSGRGVTEASRAMYNLAQAIGVGSVKLMDWKSIQNANMDTVEFKETVIQTAVELGILKKVGDDFYTAVGKKQKVTVENFSSTLNTGWFNSKLLISVLKRYSEFTEKVYEFMEENPEFETASEAMKEMKKRAEEAGEEFDELGYKWFLSSQEAKTFEEAVNSVKDAVSTGWMNTFELIFGNYERARQIWTDLSEDLYNLFAEPGNKRNDFLYETLSSNYQKLKDNMKEAGLSSEEFEKQLQSTMESLSFGKEELKDIVSEYGSLSNALDQGAVSQSWIDQAFRDIVRLKDGTKRLSPTLEEVQQIVTDTWSGKYGSGKERIEAYEKLGYDAEALQKLVGIYTKKGKIELEDLAEAGIEAEEGISESWKDFIENNKDLVDSLDELSGRELLISSFFNTFRGVAHIAEAVRDGLGEVFSITPDTAHNILENLYNFTSYLNLSEESLEKVKTLVSNMATPFKSLAILGKRFIEGLIGDSIENGLVKFGNKLKNTFDKVYFFFEKYAEFWKNLETSDSVSEFISNFTNGFSDKLVDGFTKIKDFISDSWVAEQVRGIASSLKSKVYNNFKKTGIGKLVDSISQYIDKEIAKSGGKSRVSKAKDFISKITGLDFEHISDGKVGGRKRAGKAAELIEKLTGIDFEHIADGKAIKGGLVNSNARKYLEQLSTLFDDAKTKIVSKASDLKSKLDEIWKSYKETGFHKTLQDFWNWSRPLLKTLTEKLVNNFTYKDFSSVITSLAALNASQVAKNLGSFIGEVKKQFKASDLFGSFAKSITQTSKSLSVFLEKSTLPETMKAFTTGMSDALKPLTDSVRAGNNELNARAFLEIAAGIGIVAGALWLFKDLEGLEEMKDPAIIVGSIGVAITGIILALNKVGSTHFEPAAYGQIMLMSGALLLISAAVRNLVQAANELTNIGWNMDSLAKIGSVIAIMFSSLGSIHLFRHTNVTHMFSIVATLLALARAVRMIVSAVNEISKLGWNKDTAAGVGGVIALIGSLALSITAIGLTGGPLFMGSALAILALSGAVRILVSAVRDFAAISKDEKNFWVGIEAIVSLIVSLGAAVALAGLGPANIFGGTALSILAMAAAIRVMVGAVKEFAALSKNPEELAASIDAIKELLGSLSSAVFKAGWSFASIGKAVTVFAFVGAIYALQNAVKAFASIPVMDLRKSIDAITSLLDSLGRAVQRSGWTLNGIGGAAAALGLAKGIQWIADATKTISEIAVNRERLATANSVIRDIMWTMVGIEAILGILNRFNFSTSLMQVAGIVAMGHAVKLIAEALADLSTVNSDRLKNAGIVIGGIMLLMSLVIGLIGRMSSEKIKGIGNAAMILGFANAVKTVADSLIKLSDLEPEKLKRGGFAIGQILAVFALIVPILSRFPVTGSLKQIGTNFIALSAGIAIIAYAIEKLGGMDQGMIVQGGIVVASLMLALSIASSAIGKLGKTSSYSGAATLIALAASVYILASSYVKLSEISEKDMSKAFGVMTALIAGIALLGKFVKVAGSDIKSAVALGILSAAVAGLAFVAKTFADMEWEQLEKAGAAIGGMGVAMWGIAKFVNIGVKAISLSAIAKLGAAVAIIGVILGGLGAVYSIPGVSDFMHDGGNFLMAIGRALGGFFGAIIGGFQEGVAQSMPAIGSAMADFATKAQPFFDMLETYKDIDPIAAIKGLSDALSSTVWSDFLARITRAFATKKENGKTVEYFRSLEAFGNSLASLVPNMTKFIDAFRDIPDAELDPVSRVVGFISTLGELTKNKQKTKLTDFAVDLKDSTTTLQEAITAWNDIPTPNANVQQIVSFLNSLAEVDIKPSGGIYTFWKDYSKSFTEFAADLANSVTTIEVTDAEGNLVQQSSTFGEAIAGWNKIPVPNGNAKAVAGFIQTLLDIEPPASGGFIGDVWSSYEASFTEFANDIAAAFPKLNEFIQSASGMEEYDKTKIDNLIAIIDSMVQIGKNTTGATYGSIYESYSSMVQEFIAANGDINSLAKEIDESNLEKVTNLLSYLDNSKTIDTSFIDAVPGKIKTFVESLQGFTIDPNLSAGLDSITNALTLGEGKNTTFFTSIGSDVANGVSQMVSVNDQLTKAKEVTTFISSFASDVFRTQNNFNNVKFGQNLQDMLDTVKLKFGELDDKDFKIDKLYNFFDSIRDLYELNFSTASEATGGQNPTNKIAAAFHAISDAIDYFNPDTSIEYLESYISWIESLSGKKTTFAEAGEAINAFVVDKDKLTSITDFINALKGEFALSPGSFEWSNELDRFVQKDGYFTNLSEDLVAMSKKLNDNEDFSGLENWKNHLNSFTAVLHSLRNLTPESVSSKLTGIISAIREALLGDNTETNKGIGDVNAAIEPIFTVLDQLNSYSENGLQNLVPDILTGITNSINNFTYNEKNLELLHEAMSQIAADLGLVNPETGGTRGSLGGMPTGGRQRVSKYDGLVEKLQNKNGSTVSTTIDDVTTSVNEMDIDEQKANFLINIADSIEKAANGIVNADPSSFGSFVQAISNAIQDNADIINEAATNLSNGILEVFVSFEEFFLLTGINIIHRIVEGMVIQTPEAIEMAATIASNILSTFDSTAQNSESSGVKFIENILKGFNVDSAIPMLEEPVGLMNETLSGAVPSGSGLANAMIDGIILVLQERLIEACEEMSLFASALAGAARASLGIHSPSKVFYEIGENVVEGFTNAIDDGSSSASKSIKDFSKVPEEELVNILNLLKGGFGSANYKNMFFDQSDITAIETYLSRLRKAEETKRHIVEEHSSGGGGGGGASAGVSALTGPLKEEKKGITKVVDSVKDFATEKLGGLFGNLFSTDGLEEVKSRLNQVGEYINEKIPESPTITPVIDTSKLKGSILPDATPQKTSEKLTKKISDDSKKTVSSRPDENGKVTNLNFTQINNSPKPVNRLEVYRQTKNQLAAVKNMLN